MQDLEEKIKVNHNIGEKLFNQYILEELLASKETVSVWRARKDKDEVVIIRELKGDIAPEKINLENSLLQSGHKNLLKLIDSKIVENKYYQILEFVDGLSLKNKIEKETKLSFRQASEIALQICEGLEYLATKKVLHEDLRPENVLIDQQGTVKLKGIVVPYSVFRYVDIPQCYYYISPEQVEFRLSKGRIPVDIRANIYSLGALLYLMVTGKNYTTFSETVGQGEVYLAANIKQKRLVWPTQFEPDIPAQLENIIVRCLQKATEDRFSNLAQLRDKLERFLQSLEKGERAIVGVQEVKVSEGVSLPDLAAINNNLNEIRTMLENLASLNTSSVVSSIVLDSVCSFLKKSLPQIAEGELEKSFLDLFSHLENSQYLSNTPFEENAKKYIEERKDFVATLEDLVKKVKDETDAKINIYNLNKYLMSDPFEFQVSLKEFQVLEDIFDFPRRFQNRAQKRLNFSKIEIEEGITKFNNKYHKVTGYINTDSKSKDYVIAEVVSDGFVFKNKVIQEANVKIYKYDEKEK